MTNIVSTNHFQEVFQRAASYYIHNLELPKAQIPALLAVEPTYSSEQIETAALNNRMLQSFAADLSQQNKADVLNSTLLAQLAADSAFSKDKHGYYDVQAWYTKFSEVLLNLGWISQVTYFQKYQTKGKSFTVDKALLEILNNLVKQSSYLLAEAALQALKTLDTNDKKLTLFNFNTTSDAMGNISIGTCTEKNNTIEYTFAALYMKQKKKIKQILFIDFSTADVELYAGSNTITLNTEVYATVREEVVKKIKNYTQNYIAALNI